MKLFRIFIICALTAMILAVTACNSGSQTTDSTDVPTGNTTVSGTEAPTEPSASKVEVMLTVKDQDGNPMVEAVVSILPVSGEGESATLTANEEGSMTVTLPEGEYTVRFDLLPEYVLGIDTTITVASGMEPLVIEVTDNTPNGTAERPFVITESTVQVTIPAGVTYHYTLFGANNRTLTYTQASVKLHYRDTVHEPGEGGLMELRMTTESPRDPAFFALQNTGSDSVDMTVQILSDPGAMDNPIPVDALETEITARVPQDGMVYYTWTATASGTVTVRSASSINNISIHNVTTSRVTDFSNGGESISLEVAEGDTVSIVVAVLGGDKQAEYNEVSFLLSLGE